MARYLLSILLWLTLVQLIGGKIAYEWTEIVFTNYPKHHKWRPTSFEYVNGRLYITFVDVLKSTPGVGVVAWFSPDEGAEWGKSPMFTIHGAQQDYKLFAEEGSIMAPMLIRADPCGDLWVMDANVYNISGIQKKRTPLFHIYNTKTSTKNKIRHFQDNEWESTSLFINLVFEVELPVESKALYYCPGLIAYLADFNAFTLLAYHYHQDNAFKFSHPAFKPDPYVDIPDDYVFNIGHHKLNGIYGLAVVNTLKYGTLLFFHPLASTREFVIPVQRLRNSTTLDSEDVGMSYDKGPFSEAGKTAYDSTSETFFFAEIKTRKIGCLNLGTVLYKNMTIPTYGRYDIDLTEGFIADLKVVGNELWILTYGATKTSLRKESIAAIIKEAGCIFDFRRSNRLNNYYRGVLRDEKNDVATTSPRVWSYVYLYFFVLCAFIL